jgi:hypothetical protein
MEDRLDTSKCANELFDLVEAEDVSDIRQVVFERMSDRLISGLTCIFKSEVGRDAMSNGGILDSKRNSWQMVEVSKSVWIKLGARVHSGSIGKSTDKMHNLLHWLEGHQRKEGVNIDVRLGLSTIIYEGAQRMMALDGRVWTWDQRIWIGKRV